MTSNQRIPRKRKLGAVVGLLLAIDGVLSMIHHAHDTYGILLAAGLTICGLALAAFHLHKGRQGHDVDTSR